MNPLFKKVFANASWLASEKVISMAANLLVAMLLARSLSPFGYGSLSYLLAIISLLGPLSSLGFNAIITRELVNNPQNNDAIMATASGFRLFGSGIGTLLCLIFAFTGWGGAGSEDQWAMAMLALANLLTAFHVVEFWFHAHVAAKSVARMRVAVIIFFSIVKVVAALSGAGLLLICGLFAMEMACIGIGFILIYYQAQGCLKWREFDFSYGFQLLKQGFWLVLSGIAAVIYLKVDQVMLAQMVSREAVGIYAVAARLSEVWYFFATAITMSLFPNLLKLKQINTERYQMRLQQICDTLFVVALVLAVGISLIASPLVSILFGKDYIPAAAILSIHIWASIFVYMRALVSKWLLAEHLLKFSLLSHGLGALINIAANWYFIPLYGGIGAAWATLLSYLVASYIAFWFAASCRPIAKVMSFSILLPLTLGYRYWK